MFLYSLSIKIGMGESIKVVGDTTGAKTQNTEFFTTDLQPDNTGTLRINFSGAEIVEIEITKDSGTSWVTLIQSTTADLDTVLTTGVRIGDQVNFRTPTASGITFDYFNVDILTSRF